VTPRFTVVVPTRDRPLPLSRCLAALAGQDYPRERFAVVVVDDGGRVPAAPAVGCAARALDVELVVQAHRGPAAARNRGARDADGLLAFTDDDCAPAPDWLSRLAEALERHPGAMVGGQVVNVLPGNRFASASQMIADIVYDHYNADPVRARFLSSNNLAVAADAFHEVNGFDARFRVVACEDRDLCDRWTHSGRPLVYAPDALVGHAHAMGLPAFLRQHFTYGRGAVHFHRLRAGRGSGRIRDEMAFHRDLRNWLVRPFRRRPPGEALATAALLVLWQTANAAGFAYESVTGAGYRS
jgi:GT2 family glycosyltransferase